jgi:ATP-binding cassette subfamily C (CFTR/MRP) protein 10
VALAGGAAYVAQDPWAMQGSVRDNILLGAPLRPERYQAALHACALLPDLAAMPAGDATAVGDRGATLSGGQRARLALARALYREDAGVVLLDDVLASVDASVAAWLVEHALRGPLLQGKTVLAVTHLPVVLEAADAVVTLDGGRVASVVERPGGGWRPPGRAPGAGGRREAADDPREYSVLPPPSAAEDDVEMGRPAAAQAAQEERETGHVRWAVYRQYMRFQGAWVPITLASLALMQASRNASDLWLSYWVAHTTAPPPHSDGLPAAPLGRATAALDPDVKFYLGVLLLLAAVNSAFTLARAFAFAQGGLVAARRLHRRLLLATLALPASFFDATPSGRVLNRFSSDTATADDSLPFIANIFLAHAFCLAGVAAVLLYTQPLLAAALLPAALAYRRLQRYYRATSRELRRPDAVARSPVYSAFASALDGGPTIRAFGAEPYFMAAAEAAVGAQQRAGLAALAASCWLGLRLQAMAAGVAAGVAALAVAQRCGVVPAGGGAAGAGLVGLSLAYVLPITGLLNGLLVTGAETEQEMVAVERIGQYLALSPQPDVLPRSPLAPAAATPRGAAAALRDGPSPGALLQVRGRSVSPPRASPAPRPQQAAGADWPSAGRVTFANVWLRYGLGPFVLQHLDLDVPAGTKLGLCGRTGAGKSSAVACLLRLEETCAGAVCIDGVDVRSVPLRRLRRAVAYVPQAPFIFSATLAENMDPLRRSTDADLAAALRHVALWEPLCALSGGAAGETPPASGVLRMRLGEGGVSLSQGQQQLLSLARVLLRRPKVVCLDECTSSVDPGTAAAMHAVTRTFLSDATVIEVAHRLSSIEDCDVVAVMEAGRVIEAGRPRDLLRERSSAFAGMIRQQRHGHGGAEARAGCRTS